MQAPSSNSGVGEHEAQVQELLPLRFSSALQGSMGERHHTHSVALIGRGSMVDLAIDNMNAIVGLQTSLPSNLKFASGKVSEGNRCRKPDVLHVGVPVRDRLVVHLHSGIWKVNPERRKDFVQELIQHSEGLRVQLGTVVDGEAAIPGWTVDQSECRAKARNSITMRSWPFYGRKVVNK